MTSISAGITLLTALSSTLRNQEELHFLRISAKLRNRIYEYVIGSHVITYIFSIHSRGGRFRRFSSYVHDSPVTESIELLAPLNLVHRETQHKTSGISSSLNVLVLVYTAYYKDLFARRGLKLHPVNTVQVVEYNTEIGLITICLSSGYK